MLTSRERVELALNHQEPDRVPLDLGGCSVSGMQVSAVYKLRQALHLDPPGTPVKVTEPYQMLGEIGPDLIDALGVDVVCLAGPKTLFGFRREGWKPWTLFDGTPVLVPAGFNTNPEPNGDILMYPEGDRSVPPSGRMPNGGFYFDAIIRQPPIDEERLNPEDNLEDFSYVSDEDLEYYRRECERLYTETDKAILFDFGDSDFGCIALVPAPWLKHPKGIRDEAEWYMALANHPDYVYKVFERQCEIAISNLEKIYRVVGERVTAIKVTGTDFGSQIGPLISPQTFRELFLPFYKQVNDWVHEHTKWKTFTHSCGSVYAFLPDFIDAGFEILNPVQTSAADMDPRRLKEEFGGHLSFWGGGVDTQRVLPFGTSDQVRDQVRERLRIFGEGGGFVFNTVHNLQGGVPLENILAMYETVREFGAYATA